MPRGQGKHKRMRDLRKKYEDLTGKCFEEDNLPTLEELEKMVKEEEQKK